MASEKPVFPLEAVPATPAALPAPEAQPPVQIAEPAPRQAGK